MLRLLKQRCMVVIDTWNSTPRKVGFEVAFNADKGHDDRTIDLTRARV